MTKVILGIDDFFVSSIIAPDSHFDYSRLYSSANEESDDWVTPYFINMDPSDKGDIRTPQAGEMNFEEEKVEVSADASSSKKRKMGDLGIEAIDLVLCYGLSWFSSTILFRLLLELGLLIDI